MSRITTHVLDTAIGLAAPNIPVELEFEQAGIFKKISSKVTGTDGRIPDLLPESHPLQKGIYRLTFNLNKYFFTQNRKSFFPYAVIVFEIENASQHHHVPLLLSGFGFSTYRGS